MHIWLRQALSVMLPDLEDLPAGPAGEERARTWFAHLLVRFVERGLRTPAQQKNYVVDARNHIRERLGHDHPALAVVGFDEATWQAINLPTHDRVEARNQHQRLLREPEKIVARAARLLGSAHSQDLAVGLAVAIGRRISELLDSAARLEPVSPWSVRFTGQRKHRGDRGGFAFEIPTLVPAADVLGAWGRLKVMVGDERMSPRHINARFGYKVNKAAEAHFRTLIPPRPGDDALYLHLFRAVYATIAVHWFCPPRVNRVLFKAEIQGHRQILGAARNPTMRRSYAASRHYDDYQIADASGTNLDGRQGIRLGEPGVALLRVFAEAVPDAEAPGRDDDEEEAKTAPDEEDEPMPPAPVLEEPANPVRMKPPAPAAAATEEPSPAPAGAGADAATATVVAEAPASPAPAPEPAAGSPGDDDVAPPPPAPARRPRPGTYRLHGADRTRLDGFRAHPEQSQADNLHGVLALAADAAQAHEQVRALTPAAARTGALAGELTAARQEADALRGQLGAEREENRRLHAALEGARQRPAGGESPAPAGAALLAVARELLEVAVAATGSPLQPRLLKLAGQALGGLQGGGVLPPATVGAGAVFPGLPPVAMVEAPTPVAPAGPRPSPEESSPGVPATPTTAALGESGDVPAATAGAGAPHGENHPPASPTPRADRPPRAVSRAAADKIDRAVQAVAAHNAGQTSHARKWALTEGSVATLTGCFRPAIRRYFEEHKEEIEAHNARHDVSGGFNRGRGKRGQRIEEEIDARPPASAEVDSPREQKICPTLGERTSQAE